MGGFVQKRLVRKRDLEKALSEIQKNPMPKAFLEQYTTPPNIAADTLYVAAYVFDDIIDRSVVELGCGTARLALGAALLGAKYIVGVDLDKVVITLTKENSKILGVKKKTEWINGDINILKGNFDTVLQNPPFGVQKRKADRKFIIKSLELGKVIYSFHKSGQSNRKFIKRFIEEHGGKITNIFPMSMEIPRMFEFHTKEKQSIKVDLYRIEGKNK